MGQPLIPSAESHCDTRIAVQVPHWQGSEGRPFKGCDVGIIQKCCSPGNDVKGSAASRQNLHACWCWKAGKLG